MRHRDVLVLALVLASTTALCAAPAMALSPYDVVAALTTGSWSWAAVPVAVVGLCGIAWLAKQGSQLASEKLHASRVARLMDTLSSVAAGIAQTMLAHPPAPADVLSAVKQAAIAEGVAYAKSVQADTIKAVAVSDDTLATRLANEVAKAMLGAAATPATAKA